MFSAPKLVPFPPKMTHVLGTRYKWNCYLSIQSKHTSTMRFSWFKNGQVLTNNSKYRIETSQDESQLTIAPLELDDAANFSCTVSNGISSDTQYTLLQITGLNFLILLKSIDTLAFRQGKFICFYNGMWRNIALHGRFVKIYIKHIYCNAYTVHLAVTFIPNNVSYHNFSLKCFSILLSPYRCFSVVPLLI